MLDITQIYSKLKLLEAARADALAVFRIGERIRLKPSRLPPHVVACKHEALAGGRGILAQRHNGRSHSKNAAKSSTYERSRHTLAGRFQV